MDPRACTVTDDAGTWPGWVLAWRNTANGWRALVRYRPPHESGHALLRERWMPARAVAERAVNGPGTSKGPALHAQDGASGS